MARVGRKDSGFHFIWMGGHGCHVSHISASSYQAAVTSPNRTTCPIRARRFGLLDEMGFTAIAPERRKDIVNMEILSTSEMTKYWHSNPRWTGTKRPYTSQQVEKLRGSIQVEHTLARLGAERLWWLLHHEDYVPALGALTGNQAVQQVQAG